MSRAEQRRFRPLLSTCLTPLEDRLAPSAVHAPIVTHNHINTHRIVSHLNHHQNHAAGQYALSAGANPHQNGGMLPMGVVEVAGASSATRVATASSVTITHPSQSTATTSVFDSSFRPVLVPSPQFPGPPISNIPHPSPEHPTTPATVPANVTSQLAQLYTEYRAYVDGGSKGTFTSSLSGLVVIKGNTVGLDIQAKTDVATLSNELTALGMQVTGTDPATKTVEGFLPIDQIPAAANLTETVGVTPIFKPIMR